MNTDAVMIPVFMLVVVVFGIVAFFLYGAYSFRHEPHFSGI